MPPVNRLCRFHPWIAAVLLCVACFLSPPAIRIARAGLCIQPGGFAARTSFGGQHNPVRAFSGHVDLSFSLFHFFIKDTSGASCAEALRAEAVVAGNKSNEIKPGAVITTFTFTTDYTLKDFTIVGATVDEFFFLGNQWISLAAGLGYSYETKSEVSWIRPVLNVYFLWGILRMGTDWHIRVAGPTDTSFVSIPVTFTLPIPKFHYIGVGVSYAPMVFVNRKYTVHRAFFVLSFGVNPNGSPNGLTMMWGTK